MKKVAVIGDGGWGTALALLLMDNGHAVTLWGPFRDYVDTMRARRENDRFLPGVPLPAGLQITADPREAADSADVAVLAVPTRFFRDVLTRFPSLIPPGASVVSVAKGLDPQTHQRMTQVAEEVLGRRPVAALSGPSLAPEVARRIPTAVVVASRDSELNRRLQAILSNGYFRVYTSEDGIGVELGGALKNVIALATGVSDGIGFGDNTRAAIITRGLAEMSRLGCALGAKPSTFAGLSGMGDLIVTCGSKWSRNRAVGERLGKGESKEQILATMQQVAEGLWNCAAARDLARQVCVDVPITEEVCAIVHEGKNPRDAVRSLLARDLKPE